MSGQRLQTITKAGRRRVEAALGRHGMLLVQGQGALPSLADLLAGKPVTTRGYSWDYVPAWNLRWELEQRPDVANLKLVAGRSTLVARPLWGAAHALACFARDGVLDGFGADDRRAMLNAVEHAGSGITGEALKAALGWEGPEGSRRFQRVKHDLCRWLCVVGEDQEEQEGDGHTHDMLWLPWIRGKVGAAAADASLDPTAALLALGRAAYPDGWPAAFPGWAKLFPVVAPAAHVLRHHHHTVT